MEDDTRLGMYSQQAFELLQQFSCGGLYEDNFVRANDNEIVFRPHPLASLKNAMTKETIGKHMLFMAKMHQSYQIELEIIGNVLLGDEEALSNYDRLKLESIIGKPLDPFKSNAIEVLESKMEEVELSISKQIFDLENRRDREIKELQKQIEELRKSGYEKN